MRILNLTCASGWVRASQGGTLMTQQKFVGLSERSVPEIVQRRSSMGTEYSYSLITASFPEEYVLHAGNTVFFAAPKW